MCALSSGLSDVSSTGSAIVPSLQCLPLSTVFGADVQKRYARRRAGWAEIATACLPNDQSPGPAGAAGVIRNCRAALAAPLAHH